MDGDSLSLQDFERATEGERIFVAELDGVLAGFCSVWEPDSFVHNLFVAKSCRRAGVGGALLEKAAQEFPLPLTLKCVAENRSALKYYLSHGWKIQQEGYSQDGTYYLMAFDGKG